MSLFAFDAMGLMDFWLPFWSMKGTKMTKNSTTHLQILKKAILCPLHCVGIRFAWDEHSRLPSPPQVPSLAGLLLKVPRCCRHILMPRLPRHLARSRIVVSSQHCLRVSTGQLINRPEHLHPADCHYDSFCHPCQALVQIPHHRCPRPKQEQAWLA